MHTINTFLFGDSKELSRPWLFQLVRQEFAGLQGVEFKEELMPFGLPPRLRVVVDQRYHFSMSYIDDESIHQSLSYVEGVTGKTFPAEKLVCEVRTHFGDDKLLDFDHITVSVYQFLAELPGAAVYDDNHKNILTLRV